MRILFLISFLMFFSCTKNEDYQFSLTGNIEKDINHFVDKDDKKNISCPSYVHGFINSFYDRNSDEIMKNVKNPEVALELFENFRDNVKKQILSSNDKECIVSLLNLYNVNLLYIESLRFNFAFKQFSLPSVEDFSARIRPGDIVLYRVIYTDRFVEPESFAHRFSRLAVVKKKEKSKIEIYHPYKGESFSTMRELLSHYKDRPLGRVSIYRPKNSELFLKKVEENIGQKEYESSFFTENDGMSFVSFVKKYLSESGHKVFDFALEMDKEKRRNFQIDKMIFPSFLEIAPDLEVVHEFLSPLLPWAHAIDRFISYMYKIRENAKFIYLFRQKFVNEKREIEQSGGKESRDEIRQLATWKTYKFFIDEAVHKFNVSRPPFERPYSVRELDNYFLSLGYPIPLQ